MAETPFRSFHPFQRPPWIVARSPVWLTDSEDSGGREGDTEYGDWMEREESLEGSLRASISKSVAYHKKGVWTFLLTAVDVGMDSLVDLPSEIHLQAPAGSELIPSQDR